MSRQPHIPLPQGDRLRYTPRHIPDGEHPTVLVVDDEASIVELLAQVLDDAGYTVLTATDGWTGLTISRAIHPELVLTDYTMPELDGGRFVRELRRHRATRDIPVVLMSALRPSKDELHGVPFLAKPFDLNDVVEIVAQHVDAPTSERSH